MDEHGGLLYQVVRYENPKRFKQRRPDGDGGWTWNLGNTRRVLYRLPQVLAAVKVGRTVWVVEGEKDVHALEAAGEVATCNPMGAGKWRDEYSQVLRSVPVVIVRDNDDAGWAHVQKVLTSMQNVSTHGVVSSATRVVEPVEGNDAADQLAAGFGVEEFVQIWPNDERQDSPPAAPPFAVPLAEFIGQEREDREPLLANEDGRAVVGRATLTLTGALGGQGKTTWAIDVLLHLAAGVDYPPFVVPRPVGVLVIENEGPQDLFAEKLEQRVEHFTHPLLAPFDVFVADWGAFTLADTQLRERLTWEIADKGYDLVFGDPLDSLGIRGVGSPEDTREFLELMKATGLNRNVAWWLNTHPRKEETKDALNEISGAWGGKPDAVFLLRMLDENITQVRQPKLRWTRLGRGPTLLFSFDPDTEAFTFLKPQVEDTPEEQLGKVVEALTPAGTWMTETEIERTVHGGTWVGQTLANHPQVFEMRTKQEAVALGRHANSRLWGLADPSQTRMAAPVQDVLDVQEGEGGVGLGLLDSPIGPRDQVPDHTPEDQVLDNPTVKDEVWVDPHTDRDPLDVIDELLSRGVDP